MQQQLLFNSCLGQRSRLHRLVRKLFKRNPTKSLAVKQVTKSVAKVKAFVDALCVRPKKETALKARARSRAYLAERKCPSHLVSNPLTVTMHLTCLNLTLLT